MAISIYNEAPISLTPSANQQNNLAPISWDTPIEVLKLKEGETIFKEGEMPKGFYLLKTGCVKVMHNRKLTRGRINSPEYMNKLVAPGEFFGFKALVRGGAYTSFAKTVKASEIWVYSKDAIHQMMNGPNNLMKMVMLQSVKDLEKFETNNQLHYLASVQERIAYQLLLLGDRFGVQTPEGILLNLKLTRNELAQLAGTINESLSRHLTDMKSDGIIDLNGKEILIKNRQALMERSGNYR